MSGAFDLAVLGSGFGGSLLAMVARRIGLSVLLLERGSHPRFAIGESTSPLTNLLLEEIAREYDLPRLLPLTSYGTWKRAYPEVDVGLKRGFTFYPHAPHQPWTGDRESQLLVAASPNDEVADTHWFRADVDHLFVREAQALGAEYVDRVSIDGYERAGDVTTLTGSRQGQRVRYETRFVVDASGPRGALSRLLGLPEATMPYLPPTQALFTHFEGVPRFADVGQGGHPPAPNEVPPYPPDDAALHHLFDGGWTWVLRFENGITSTGIAVEDRVAEELRLAEGAAAWERFLARYPSIREHLGEGVPVRPFVHAPRLAYRSGAPVGEGWALLPSAAAFIDPLFSTGFPLLLLGVARLGRIFREEGGTPQTAAGLRQYADVTAREAEATARLVGACYTRFTDFPSFAALSMLYFVAASYSEMARRLERPDLAPRFLLSGRPEFAEVFRKHTGTALAGQAVSPAEVARDLEPFNIAGLCDPAKRNWYGVDLDDVVRGAGKLETTPEAVWAFFAAQGW